MGRAAYIALDTETGGVTQDISLLTAYFLVLDENLNPIDELNLVLKPDDGIYRVNAEALSINKIDLVKHDSLAQTKTVSGKSFRDFIEKHSENGKTKLVPIGHNVFFDLGMVYDQVLNKLTSQKYISYRVLDTGVIAQALKAAGMIPDDVSGGLQSLVDFYKVQRREAHDAKNDVLMTVDILKAELNHIRGNHVS